MFEKLRIKSDDIEEEKFRAFYLLWQGELVHRKKSINKEVERIYDIEVFKDPSGLGT